MFKGKCRNCGKVCGYKAADCKKCKGELHGGRENSNEGGNTGSNKKCNFCGLKGHKEAECYKKFPKKAPLGTRIRPPRQKRHPQALRYP